jgi:PKD repeat protein
MKQKVYVLALLLTLFTPSTIYAHNGTTPLLKVNTKYAYTNPYYLQDAPTQQIAMDTVDDVFLPNEAIEFTVNTQAFGLPAQLLQNTKTYWDFGDNSQDMDKTNVKHHYKKPGSYLVSLKMQFQPESAIAEIDSVQINIVPEKNYALPKAQIKITPPKQELGKPITFEAVPNAFSGKNLRYIWTIGSTEKHTEKKLTKTFTDNNTYKILHLKIVDENNLASDTGAYISIYDSLTITPINPQDKVLTTSTQKKHLQQATDLWTTIKPFLPFGIILILLGTLLISKNKKTNILI